MLIISKIISQRRKVAEGLSRYANNGLPEIFPYKLEQLVPEIGNIQIMNVVVTEDNLCLNKDCGVGFICDSKSKSCIKNCDWFNIDEYLSCSKSYQAIQNNLAYLLTQLDNINEKTIQLPRRSNEKVMDIQPFFKDLVIIGLLLMNTIGIIYIYVRLSKRTNAKRQQSKITVNVE